VPPSQYNASFDLSSNARQKNYYQTQKKPSKNTDKISTVATKTNSQLNSQDEPFSKQKIVLPIKNQKKANKVMKLYKDVYKDLQQLSKELNQDANNRRVTQIQD
jgi:hypothetical protein